MCCAEESEISLTFDRHCPQGVAGRERRAKTDFHLPFKDPYGKYKLVAAGKAETIGIPGIAHLNS